MSSASRNSIETKKHFSIQRSKPSLVKKIGLREEAQTDFNIVNIFSIQFPEGKNGVLGTLFCCLDSVKLKVHLFKCFKVYT